MFDFSNFYIGTAANFIVCKNPERNPDYISKSGSAYWDEGDRVIRWSDHWHIVGSCYWQNWALNNETDCSFGECFYSDFRKLKS